MATKIEIIKHRNELDDLREAVTSSNLLTKEQKIFILRRIEVCQNSLILRRKNKNDLEKEIEIIMLQIDMMQQKTNALSSLKAIILEMRKYLARNKNIFLMSLLSGAQNASDKNHSEKMLLWHLTRCQVWLNDAKLNRNLN